MAIKLEKCFVTFFIKNKSMKMGGQYLLKLFEIFGWLQCPEKP